MVGGPRRRCGEANPHAPGCGAGSAGYLEGFVPVEGFARLYTTSGGAKCVLQDRPWRVFPPLPATRSELGRPPDHQPARSRSHLVRYFGFRAQAPRIAYLPRSWTPRRRLTAGPPARSPRSRLTRRLALPAAARSSGTCPACLAMRRSCQLAGRGAGGPGPRCPHQRAASRPAARGTAITPRRRSHPGGARPAGQPPTAWPWRSRRHHRHHHWCPDEWVRAFPGWRLGRSLLLIVRAERVDRCRDACDRVQRPVRDGRKSRLDSHLAN